MLFFVVCKTNPKDMAFKYDNLFLFYVIGIELSVALQCVFVKKETQNNNKTHNS